MLLDSRNTYALLGSHPVILIFYMAIAISRKQPNSHLFLMFKITITVNTYLDIYFNTSCSHNLKINKFQ